MKDSINTKTNQQLLDVLLRETAKARNELRCAEGDLEKANRRVNFLLVLANELIHRSKEQ